MSDQILAMELKNLSNPISLKLFVLILSLSLSLFLVFIFRAQRTQRSWRYGRSNETTRYGTIEFSSTWERIPTFCCRFIEFPFNIEIMIMTLFLSLFFPQENLQPQPTHLWIHIYMLQINFCHKDSRLVFRIWARFIYILYNRYILFKVKNWRVHSYQSDTTNTSNSPSHHFKAKLLCFRGEVIWVIFRGILLLICVSKKPVPRLDRGKTKFRGANWLAPACRGKKKDSNQEEANYY